MTARADTTARELGVFLRQRRERLAPADTGPRRRTPGLRREEVAERAGVSIDYVVRLEQGRDLHPSPEVLDALGGALQLSDDERAYVVELARRRRGGSSAASSAAEPAEAPADGSPAARLVHDLELPAMLLDRRMDVLAWNRAMSVLMIDLAEVPAAARNSMELCLFHPRLTGFWVDREQVLREGIADLRAAWAAHPDDARLGARIEDWCTRSPEFARLWEHRDVRVSARGTKRLHHPGVGALTLTFEALAPLADPEHRLVVYRADDAVSRERLERLTSAPAPGA